MLVKPWKIHCTPILGFTCSCTPLGRHPLMSRKSLYGSWPAVGTILCSSYWSLLNARVAAIEHEKLLKDRSEEVEVLKELVHLVL
ncbi:signal peptide peptidase-like 2 [Spinacia oleracea]|uniref:Signal peptide peptidase-like 2 n=1 Tax=Spinacia oleracea TaxID=3562 RepID=A0ABM3QZT9_SPIOL|nr:signal peptide peptidase-like 2 [Spinacia oleracea]